MSLWATPTTPTSCRSTERTGPTDVSQMKALGVRSAGLKFPLHALVALILMKTFSPFAYPTAPLPRVELWYLKIASQAAASLFCPARLCSAIDTIPSMTGWLLFSVRYQPWPGASTTQSWLTEVGSWTQTTLPGYMPLASPIG